MTTLYQLVKMVYAFDQLVAGGNQRELARQKNAKKQNDHPKGRKDDGLSAAARKQRDAEIMQQKQKNANEKGDPKSK